MNGFFEIIAEGAMLEAAVADKYLLTGVNEGNIKDYVSDKAYAAGQTIKKLYEKVMNAIDEVINKVLNYKDEKMLGFAADKFKKHKFDPDKKTVEFYASIVHVDKFAGAVEILKTQCNKDIKVGAGNISDDSLAKDDWTEKEKSVLADVKNDYFYKVKATNNEIKLDSLSDVNEATKKCFIEREGKIALSGELYTKAYDFITGKKEKSVAKLLSNLRELKVSVKKQYNLILRELSEEVRSMKKDEDNEIQVSTYKKNAKKGYSLIFNITVACIISLMSVIREGVRYCKIMSKAIASKAEKKKAEDNGPVNNGLGLPTHDNNSAALSFLESAMAEAELDIY